MHKIYNLVFILFVFTMLIANQKLCAQDCNAYFDRFKPVTHIYYEPDYPVPGLPKDSISYGIKLINRDSRQGMCLYNFEINYEKKKYDFWIGIKDSTFYCFKNNRLKHPVRMFSFAKKIKDEVATPFYPFFEKVSVSDMIYGRGLPYPNDDKLFNFYSSNINEDVQLSFDFLLQSLYITLHEGIKITVLDVKKWHFYSNLD